MEIGPFGVRDAQQIEQLLDRHQIEYEINPDEEMKQSQLQEHHDKIRLLPTAAIGSLDLRYIYFIISDDDYPKISQELEHFGIVGAIDG
jgi:hypothetical protein